jgi:hypothetical protein
VKDIVKSLKWKSSYGYDEMPQRILKISLPFITSPITFICKKTLSLGIFPSWLKYAQITPVHKKGDRTDMANYRPISLLTAFSKIFERVIYNRLHYHFNVNKMIAHKQYGFRSKLSTDTATYDLINSMLSALNNKFVIGGLF